MHRRTLGLFFSVAVTSALWGLPQIQEVASGSIDASLEDKTLVLRVSDQAIVNYQSFNIAPHESVQFIQPNSSSCVLNRVVGDQASSILGTLSSNGQLFLVNPSGVYFGPDARVDVGSLLVSTLGIANEDFLAKRWEFALAEGTEGARIVNQGKLSAAPEGWIALLSPMIRNEGDLVAAAGRIALLSGEKIAVDFSGDGLLSFSVDGSLEQALIEQLGSIGAPKGQVFLHMKTADRIVQEVLNTDGIIEGTQIVKENGVIRLTAKSELHAKQIIVDGPGVEVEGVVTASDEESGAVGGSVYLLGDSVVLRGARVEASGDAGGGTVLIGGDYHGEGEIRTSAHVSLDDESVVAANALTEGNGGKIIVWGDRLNRFEGKLRARGGKLGGNGGFVETSCAGPMVITGHVDTTGPQGAYGEWLIDPTTIVVDASGGGSLSQAENCGVGATVTIPPATIAAATTTVNLCATNGSNCSITVTDAISGMASNLGITFTVGGAGPTFAINLNNNITTSSGFITFTGANVTLGGSFTGLSTVAAGNGAAITFSGAINGGGTRPMTVTAGTGSLTVGSTIGATTQLTALTVTANGGITLNGIGNASTGVTGATSLTSSGGITLNGGIYSTVGSQSYVGNVTLGANTTITTTGNAVSITGSVDGNAIGRTLAISTAGANISVGGTVGSIQTLGGLTLNAGAGIITLSSVGTGITAGSNAGYTLTSTASPTGILLNGGVYNTSGSVGQTYAGHTKVGSSVSFQTTNAPISFQQTLNGTSSYTEQLTLDAGTGSGSITWSGAVGNLVPLESIIVSRANGVSAAGAITASSFQEMTPTGANALAAISTNNVGGILLSGSTIALSGALTTTDGGDVTIINTGLLTFPSAATATLAGQFIQEGGGTVLLGANLTTDNKYISFGGAVTLSGNVVLDTGADLGSINFGSTINGAFSLTGTAGLGTVRVTGAIGTTTPLTGVTLSGNGGIILGAIGSVGTSGSGAVSLSSSGTISLNGTIYHATSHSYTGGVALKNHVTIQSVANNNVLLTGTIDGDGVSTRNLSINTGTVGSTGNITITGAIGTRQALGSLSLDARSGAVAIGSVGSGSSPGATSGMSVAGSGGINLAGGQYITSGGTQLYSNGTTISAVTVLNSSNSAITFASTLNGTAAGAQALSIAAGSGALTFTGAVGNTQRLGGITINSASSVTASSTINANSIREQAATGANSFQAITTTAVAGIVISGTTVSLNGAISTAAGGPLNITNTDLLTISGACSLDGNFSQSGGGSVSLGAGITTTNDNIVFTNPVTLTAPVALSTGSSIGDIYFSSSFNGAFALSAAAGAGTVFMTQSMGTSVPLASLTASGTTVTQASDVQTTGAVSYTGVTQLGGSVTTGGGAIGITGSLLRNVVNSATLSTSGGNITIAGTIDADVAGRNLTLTAGGGAIAIAGIIGDNTPMNNFTASGATVSLGGIGGVTAGVSGALMLTATGAINYTGTNYYANSQTHTAGTFFNMNSGSAALFAVPSGNISFIGGTIQLGNGTDMYIRTTNGNLTFPALLGTSLESVDFDLGTGTANLGSIGSASSSDIQNVVVSGGAIYLGGAVYGNALYFNSSGNILNASGSVDTIGRVFSAFDATGGGIGTQLSPIRVASPSFVLAGASSTATFSGSTIDGTIHCLPSNPSTQLLLNGTLISCSSNSSSSISLSQIPLRDFYVPGIYSADYNLSNDFYFMGDLIDTRYMAHGSAPMFVAQRALSVTLK